ncbi:fasciclin-like arabinogalactan protein 21 [Pyrus ussuriensis x Pyrus communis]|uniref:Fasciclin-like arabinogalactan protein 21 n=1 Tax=Pyrus ussuriensis x Pyrus communis TaxID=2448454 RepID=A0A5N5EYV6_9ROSA|nr:fasciclin-like arabinogalactan protein 21 [Pyrus ussuriensis x Pyrus communis]
MKCTDLFPVEIPKFDTKNSKSSYTNRIRTQFISFQEPVALYEMPEQRSRTKFNPTTKETNPFELSNRMIRDHSTMFLALETSETMLELDS